VAWRFKWRPQKLGSDRPGSADACGFDGDDFRPANGQGELVHVVDLAEVIALSIAGKSCRETGTGYEFTGEPAVQAPRPTSVRAHMIRRRAAR